MRYTVVVVDIGFGSEADYRRWRFNKVRKSIIRFLVNHHFSFSVAIYHKDGRRIINGSKSSNYIEVYLKSEHAFVAEDERNLNELHNKKLFRKLDRYNPRRF